MDTPRKWQVASLATAVASISIGGLMLSRPNSEAVASIELQLVSDSGDLNLASPDGTSSIPDGSPEALRRQIVTSEAVEGPTRTTTSTSSPEDPDGPTTSGGTSRGGSSTVEPAPSPQPADPASPDSASSIDSDSSIDS